MTSPTTPLRTLAILLAVGVLAGCESSATAPPPPSALEPPRVSFSLSADTTDLFVGMRLWVDIRAFDAQGGVANSAAASITVSDDAVAALEQAWSWYHLDGATREWRAGHTAVFQTLAAGRLAVRASMHGTRDSLVTSVRAIPTTEAAVVVDSFSVLEYAPACAPSCAALVYFPVLKLRSEAGKPLSRVVAVRISMPSWTSGWCRGGVALTSTEGRHISGADADAPLGNELSPITFGAPFSDGMATAEVIVREAAGYAYVTLTGPIARQVASPALPERFHADEYWGC